MAKYYFPNIDTTFEDVELEKINPVFYIGDPWVLVFVDIKNTGVNMLIGTMENTEDWGDDEVIQFAQTELEKYKV